MAWCIRRKGSVKRRELGFSMNLGERGCTPARSDDVGSTKNGKRSGFVQIAPAQASEPGTNSVLA